MARIAGFGDDAREIGSQGFDMRLHARACPPFSPKQPFSKLRGPSALLLRPDDERFAQHLFPFPERAPNIAVRSPHRLRRMTDRAKFQDCSEQIKERIAERGAALFPRLERIPQLQAEG